MRDDAVPARMIATVRGKPALAVGIPLPSVGASYFEIVSLQELQSTLNSVGVSLLGATVLTTSLGVLLGVWASRRAVRPLADAAQAAKAIAGGRLDTRLESTDDKDLRELSTAFNDMAAALAAARRARRPVRQRRQPRAALAAHDAVGVDRGAAVAPRRDARAGRCRPRPAGGRRGPLPEPGRGPAGDLPLRRRRRAARARGPAGGRVRAPGHQRVVRARRAREGQREGRAARDPGRQAPPGARDRQPRRQRPHPRRPATTNGDDPTFGVEVEVSEPPGDAEPVAHVWISVADHGPGVLPEERHLVFERFSRGGGAGRRGSMEGAGLGLALVDEHVRLHGGRVWVEDRADGEPGARFIIELPAEEA